MAAIRAIFSFLRRWVLHFFEGRTLKDKQKRYKFGQVGALPGLNVQAGVPFDELPRVSWLAQTAAAFLRIRAGGGIAAETATAADPALDELSRVAAASGLPGIDEVMDAAKALETVTAEADRLIERHKAASATSVWPTTKQEYDALFSGGIPLPAIAGHYTPTPQNEGHFDDGFFANLQTAGFNPIVLAGRATLPDGWDAYGDTQYSQAVGAGFGSDTLQDALDDGRIFVADYSAVAQLIATPPNLGGDFPGQQQKYLEAPVALFVLPPTATPQAPDSLRPIGIQLRTNGTIFFPNDPDDANDGLAWTQAKYAVNAASGNYHELVSHLGWTHLVIEPFAVCTQRNLGEHHELYKLLVPHFEGTIFINNAAVGRLINSGGLINRLLAPEIATAQAFAVAARATGAGGLFGFNAQFAPVEMKRRSVMDPRLVYPYRDDALLIWEAIGNWVSDYVDVFYANDRHVRGDRELQNWAAELISDQGGQIQDFGDGTADHVIGTLSYLKEVLTMIIFTSSAQHAAVNFAQSEIMLYAPAVPLALYGPGSDVVPSTASTYSTGGTSPGLLPSESTANLQRDLLALLGGVHHTQLGQYRSGHFTNQRVTQALQQFHSNLVGIEQDIEAANAHRPLDYRYLLPSRIPQSINI